MSSSTERSRKYREKLKSDKEKLEAYKKKDRERKRKEYIKNKLTLGEIEKLRRREKKAFRQRQWRASKTIQERKVKSSQVKGNETAGPFKSPQSQPDIQKFRKHMIVELHKQTLLTATSDIQVGKYYAVDYVNAYCIGRALETNNQFTRFKFLHRAGAKKFSWPRSDDIEEKHITCIFYGPVKLIGSGPFEIDELHEVETIFKAYIAKKGR